MPEQYGNGLQASYEKTLAVNSAPQTPDSLFTTTDEVYEKRQREEKKARMEALLQIAGLGGAAYGTAVLVNSNPGLANLLQAMPGANRYAEKHKIARDLAIANKYDPVDLEKHYSSQTFGRSVLSMISSAEELSPFGILKTLQVSNLIEPFVGLSRTEKSIKFTGSAIAASEDFYDKLIYSASKGRHRLTGDHVKYGFTLKGGKLYENLYDGSVSKTALLDHVHAVTTHSKLGDSVSPNRVLSKFAQLFGTSLGFNTYDKEQMAFIAGSSKVDVLKKWTSAAISQGMEIGFKTMDNPIAGAEELLRAGGVGATGLFDNKYYLKAKKLANVQFGTEGVYNQPLQKSIGIFAKNLAAKSAGLYLGYQAVNHVLDVLTPESSVWNDGLVSGLTASYANARVGAARLLADPFQRYKNAQEDAADGSTSLMTLVGFPAAGAMLGGSLPYYKRLFDSATKGIEAASNASDAKTHGYGLFQGVADRLKLGKTTSSKSKAFQGAVAGALVSLPFLPGALIGESSKELKDKYLGRELEANRANRFWLAGGGSWHGDNIKNFEASRVARTVSGAKDEVLYDGDNNLKRQLDPFYSPLRYLKNPYAFEEKHTEDMPYPVWGMNVDYGSFLGKMYQGTVGELIKPTVINERFLEDSQLLKTGALETYHSPYSVKGSLIQTALQMSNPLQSAVPEIPFADKTDVLGTYPISFTAKPNERKLMAEGLMMREESPEVNPYKIAASQTYSALQDFSGLKGFTSGLIIDKLGYDPSQTRLQLARSGTGRSVADDIKDENLGDMFGLGEFQRRVIPTSAGSRQNDVNPMLNSAAPSWMPHNEEKYYNDFSKGNYWNKVAKGEVRLAGKGFEALNENLKGVDPEDYPLVYQYQILSDTAMGSPEQIALKEHLIKAKNDGKLSDTETDIFFKTLTQEQAKSRLRDFSEYKTAEERSRLSLGGKVLNTIWETAAHNSESVLEPLTPFRPGAKFIHKRTAIEDYEKTQLQGPDTAIWTNPYSHFIRPSMNRMANLVIPGVNKPREAQERDNVEEYFDKLEYLKARRNGRTNDALRTVHGATAAGILDTSAYNKFRSGLSDNQRLYLESFSKTTDSKDRQKILEMLPTNVGKGYQQIWKNLSAAESAKNGDGDLDSAIKTQYIKDSAKYIPKGLMRAKNPYSRTNEEVLKDEQVERAVSGSSGGMGKKDELVAQAKEMRLRAADQEAEQYISATTGVPGQDWIGWDPRLKLDEVKLRTLQLGNADTYEYGYWDSDLQRNARLTVLDDENFVTKSYEEIQKGMRTRLFQKVELERSLFSNGLIPNRITMSDASRNDLEIRLNE